MHKFGDLAEGFDLRVFPETTVLWHDTAFGEDGASFDYDETKSAGEDTTG